MLDAPLKNGTIPPNGGRLVTLVILHFCTWLINVVFIHYRLYHYKYLMKAKWVTNKKTNIEPNLNLQIFTS